MDARTRYFRQVRRLRRSARRWSVLAGTFAGASAVPVPYHGLGWPDAIWTALTGGTAALTFWRWSDLRELAAQPAPEPVDPARAAALTRARIGAVLARLPGGAGALAELRRGPGGGPGPGAAGGAGRGGPRPAAPAAPPRAAR